MLTNSNMLKISATKNYKQDNKFGHLLCTPDSRWISDVSPNNVWQTKYNGALIADRKSFYIRDNETDALWSLTSDGFERADEFNVSYQPGQATFYCLQNKIGIYLTICPLPDTNGELWLVRLLNQSAKDRSLTFSTYLELCIGSPLESKFNINERSLFLSTSPHNGNGEINENQLTMFAASSLIPNKYEVSKSSFLDNYHNSEISSTLNSSITIDPIISLSQNIEMPIDGSAEFAFVFGVAANTDDAEYICKSSSTIDFIKTKLNESHETWRKMSSSLSLECTNKQLSEIINTWLPYECYTNSIINDQYHKNLDPWLIAEDIRGIYPISTVNISALYDSIIDFASSLTIGKSYMPDNSTLLTVPPEELLWFAYGIMKYIAETGDHSLLEVRMRSKDDFILTFREHLERIINICKMDNDIKTNNILMLLLNSVSVEWSALNGKKIEHSNILITQTLTEDISRCKSITDIKQVFSEYFDNNQTLKNNSIASLAYFYITESLFGIKPSCKGLKIEPNIPNTIEDCVVKRVYRGDTYVICFTGSPNEAKGYTMDVDGVETAHNIVSPFLDGKEHRVNINSLR